MMLDDASAASDEVIVDRWPAEPNPGCEPDGANLVGSIHTPAIRRPAQASDAFALSQRFAETEPRLGMGLCGKLDTFSAVQADGRETDVAMLSI